MNIIPGPALPAQAGQETRVLLHFPGLLRRSTYSVDANEQVLVLGFGCHSRESGNLELIAHNSGFQVKPGMTQ